VNYVVEYRSKRKVFRETVHIEKLKPYFERTDFSTDDKGTDKENKEDIQESKAVTYDHKKNDDDDTIQTHNNNDAIIFPPVTVQDEQPYNLRRRKTINYRV